MKSKLGISVGLFGAGIYLGNLVGGILVSILLLAYVLLFEENEWLKVSVIKATVITMLFAFVTMVVELVPRTIGTIDNLMRIFDGDFTMQFLSRITLFLNYGIGLLEMIVFLLLAVKALNQRTMSIPVVDGMIKKHYMSLK